MPPSTSSSSGDKKSNGMKPITLPSVAKYLLNVGKSASLVAVDYLGEIAPTSQEFLETNEDLFKEVVSSVVDYKQTLKKATATLKKSKVWEAFTEGKNALFEDLRTGNFYNKQREDSLNARAIGMDLDFGDEDMEFDDSMFSFDDDDRSETAKQTRVLDLSIEAAAKANASITAQSGTLVAQTVKDSTQIMFVQNREMMNKVQAGMTGMANILTDMNKFMNGPLVTGLQNSKTYQEKSLQHLGNLEGMMNELLTMQRNLYAAKQEEYKEEGYNTVFDSDGIPDLKEYGNQIKKNIKSFLGPEFDMLFGNAFGKDSNGLLMMVASPLKFIPEFFVKKIIPETVKKSVEVFDQSLSGLFSSLISRITNMGEGEGALDPRSILARILGVDLKIKGSIDTSKFKRGPVPFDGETRQTILKVIPGYLARIEAALTGGMERMYDLTTGKWTTIAKVAEDYGKRRDNAYKDSWGDAAEPVKQYIQSLKNAKNKDGSDNKESTQRAKDLEDAFNKILYKVYKEDHGDFLGYRQKRDTVGGGWTTAPEYYEVNEELYKIIMEILSNPKNRKNMTHIARNVMSERESWNDYLKMAEERNSTLISLFDKSYNVDKDANLIGANGVGYKGGPKNMLMQAVDEHGNNVFFYLREMLGNLMNIADGTSTGGGKKRRRTTGRMSAARRVEELIKARNEAQRDKQEKDKNGENTEREEKTLAEINEEIEKARIEAEKELDENGVPIKDRDLDDSEQAFVRKLKDATTFGEKFQAVQNAIDKAMKKPAMILTSMLDTADRKLYEMLFGKEELMNLDKDEHRTPQGVVDMILIKMEESFDKFNDWLKETVMDPVKQWMDEIGLTRFFNKVKDKAKDAWDWTKDKLHLGAITDKLKEKFKWGKNEVTDAFDSTALDLAGATGNDLFKRISPSYNRLQSMLNTPDRKLKNISLALSRRELTQKQYDDAIAAGMSPREALAMQQDQIKKVLENFNKYKKNNAKAKAKEELRERAAQLGGDKGIRDQIAYHQKQLKGDFKGRHVERRLLNFDSSSYYDFIKSPKMKGKLTREQIKEGLAIYKQAIIYKALSPTKAREEVLDHFGIKLDEPDATLAASGKFVTQRGLAVVSPGETILPATYDKAKQKTQLAHEKAYARRFGIKGASYYAEGKEGQDSDTGMAQTIDPQKDQKGVWNTIKAIGREMNGSDSVVDTVADMLIGGGVSLITGMIGGPLLGAAVGAGVSLTKHSATFREMLFGKDLEDGSHEGGVIPKTWQDTAAKYLPDVKKYGIVGGVAGLLTPFGLVGGIAAGSAIAMAKNNEDVQEFLFGKMQEDEEGHKFRDGGIISKAFRDQVKKAVPNMLIGAAGMAIAGPFGIFPNAVMGSALGLLTSTDKFKDALLGTKDENGKRRGGVLGALKTGFVNPLIEWGKNLMEETKKWLKETVWNNTKRFLKPFTKMIANAAGSVASIIGGFFNEKITMPIYDTVLHKFLEPAGKVAGKLVKAPIALAKTIFGAPFKMLGAVGDNIRATQIGKGTADDMTAAERVDFRNKHQGRHIFNAIAGRDKFGRMDRMLASESFNGKEGVEKMEKMREDIDMLFNTKQKLNDKFTELCNKCIQTISDILNSDVVTLSKGNVVSCFTAVGYSNVKRLKDLIAKGQIKEAIKEIRSGKWDILASTDVLDKIQDTLEQFAEPIQTAFLQKKDSKTFSKTLMKKVAKDTGLTKMKDLQRLGKNLDTEIKARKKDVEEEEEKTEEQRMREELQEKQWGIERDFLEKKSESFLDVLDDISGYLEDILGYAKKEDEERNAPEEGEVEGQQSLFGDDLEQAATGAKDEFDYEANMKAKKAEIAKTLAGTMNSLGNNMDRDNLLNAFSGRDIFKDKDVIEMLKKVKPEDFFSEIMSSPEFNMELKNLFEGTSTGERKKLRRKFGNFLNTYSDDIHKYFEDINPSNEDMAEEAAEVEAASSEEDYGPADGYRGWRKMGAKLAKKIGIKHPDELQKDVNKRLSPLGWIGKGARAIGRGKRSLFHQIGDIGRGIKEGAVEGFRDGNTDGETIASVTSKYSSMRKDASAKFLDSAEEKKNSIFDRVKSIGGMLIGKKQDVQEAMNSGYNVQSDDEGNRAAIGPDGKPLDTATSGDYEDNKEEEKEIARANATSLGEMAKGITGMATGFLGNLWNKGKNIAGGFIGKVGDLIDNFGGPVFKVLKLIFGGATLIAASGHFAEFWTNSIWNPVLKPFVTEKLLPGISNVWNNAKEWIDENIPSLGNIMDSVGDFCKGLISNPMGTIIDWYTSGIKKAWDYIVDPLKVAIYQAIHAQKIEDLYGEKSLSHNEYQEVDNEGNLVYIDANGNKTANQYAADGTENTPSMLSSDATRTDLNFSTVGDTLEYNLDETYLGDTYALDKYTSGIVVIKNRTTGSYVKFKLGHTKVEFGYELDDDGNPYDAGVEAIVGSQVTGGVAGGIAGGAAAGMGASAAVGALGAAAIPGIGWVVGGIALGGLIIGAIAGSAAGKKIGVAISVYERKNGRKVAQVTYNTTDKDSAEEVANILHSFGWYGPIDEMQSWPQFAQLSVSGNTNVELGSASDAATGAESALSGTSKISGASGSRRGGLSGKKRKSLYAKADEYLDKQSGSSREDGHIYQNGLDMANEKLGNSTIGEAGCGPVSVTNLINRMGGDMDVDTAARAAESGGYIDSTGGTTTNYISDMLNRAGMSAQETMDKQSVFESLRQGNPAVLLGNSGKEQGTPFGANDHYINAMGMDNSGNIYAEDPDLPQSMVRYRASDVMRDMDVGIMTGAGRSRQQRNRNRPGGAVYGQRLTSSIRRQGFKVTGHKRSGKAAVAMAVNDGGGGSVIQGVDNKIWMEGWVVRAAGIIDNNESGGSYSCVVKSDSGSGMSIGKSQWHNGRAGDLLYKIIIALIDSKEMTEEQVIETIGNSLYVDAMNPTQFGARKCSNNEEPGLKTLLDTDISKNIQDQQIMEDIKAYYYDHIKNKGLKLPGQENEVIYLCDMYHRGPNSTLKFIDRIKTTYGGADKLTLDIIHAEALKDSVFGQEKYKSRQENTYNALMNSEPAGLGTIQMNGYDIGAYLTDSRIEAQYASGYTGSGSENKGVLGMLSEALSAVFRSVYGDAFDFLFGNRSIVSGNNNEGITYGTQNTFLGHNKVSSAQEALPGWLANIEGKIPYSLDGPQDPEKGSASCASTTWYAYRKALGLEPIGDTTYANHASSSSWLQNDERFVPIYTSPKYNNYSSAGGYGDLSKLQPGDVLFYARSGSTAKNKIGHTAMYAGDGMIWNHGGNPHMGPAYKSIDKDAASLAMVKRYKPFTENEMVPFWNPDGTEGKYLTEEQAEQLYESEDRLRMLGGTVPGDEDKDDPIKQSVMYIGDKTPSLELGIDWSKGPVVPNFGYKNKYTIPDPSSTKSATTSSNPFTSPNATPAGLPNTSAIPAATTPTPITSDKIMTENPYGDKKYLYQYDDNAYQLSDGTYIYGEDLYTITRDQFKGARHCLSKGTFEDLTDEQLNGIYDIYTKAAANKGYTVAGTGKSRKKKKDIGGFMRKRNQFMSAGKSRFRKPGGNVSESKIRNKYKDFDPDMIANDDIKGLEDRDRVYTDAELRMRYSGGKSRSGTAQAPASTITQDQFLQTIIALLRIIAKNSEKVDRIVDILDSIDIHVSKSDVRNINKSPEAKENLSKAIAKARRSGRGSSPFTAPKPTKGGDFGGAQKRDRNDLEYVIQTLQDFAMA